TACRVCNERKGNCTPEQAGMEPVYLPYVPNRGEYLILTNRRILADKMEFLTQHLPAHSRLRLACSRGAGRVPPDGPIPLPHLFPRNCMASARASSGESAAVVRCLNMRHARAALISTKTTSR